MDERHGNSLEQNKRRDVVPEKTFKLQNYWGKKKSWTRLGNKLDFTHENFIALEILRYGITTLTNDLDMISSINPIVKLSCSLTWWMWANRRLHETTFSFLISTTRLYMTEASYQDWILANTDTLYKVW